MISFDQEVCRNLKAALRREWLETNGLGSFASSTIVGLNTRRYHGLLIAVTTPPVGRLVLLSKVEETLIIDGQRFELSANRYPGIVHPQGYRYLTHFRLDPFPVLTYAVESMPIEKSIFMIHGGHSTVIQYEFRVSDVACRGDSGKGASVTAFADGRVQLEVPPLIAFREYHRTTRENGTLNPHVEREKALATVAPYEGLPALHFAHDADEIDVAGHWYRHFEYEVERERGLDFVEDLFSPFAMRYDVSRRTLAVVERDLLTPSGLRSLAPGDPNYRGRYEGNPWSQDGAYHRGTVWTWLMGPFITAYLKVNGRNHESLEQARQWLEALREHLSDAGLGQISEIFDGDAPHRPSGCIAQAWSVAEVLRAAVEDCWPSTRHPQGELP